jgi:hypothetical protein
MKLLTTFAALSLAGFPINSAVLAADTSLYAEAAPSDASFVRFIGFDDQDHATFAGFDFSLKGDKAAKYIPVSASLLQDTAPGRFISVLRAADGALQTIPEAPRTRRSKVALFLVNGTEMELELRLADGSVAVIEDVEPATAGQREVNPVSIALGVFERGSTTPLARFDVTMKRGQNLSFIADHAGIRLIENQFAEVAK